tara:strand:+ start:208 stop:657 length:450 start_codon:yes stop_codon:yes gene_type:complete
MKTDIRPKKSWWIKLGEEIIAKIKKRTLAGVDVEGNEFKAYSTKYERNKANGLFKRQSSNSTKPNLTLTGDMLRDFQVRKVGKDNVQIGFTGTFAQRLSSNADNGRVITSKQNPVSKSENKYIVDELNKVYKTEILKAIPKKQVVKVKL